MLGVLDKVSSLQLLRCLIIERDLIGLEICSKDANGTGCAG